MRSSGVAAVELGFAPGPLALQAAADLELDALSDASLLDLAADVERSLSWAAALRAQVIAAYASRGVREAHDEVSQHDLDWHRERLAAACQTSPHEAHVRSDTALALRDRLPLTRTALTSGSLPWAQAVALARETGSLDADQSARVEQHVLADPRAVSVGQVTRAARAAVAAIVPVVAEEQAATAQESRSLRMWPDREVPGLVCLQASLTTDAAAVVAGALDALAVLGGPDDRRHADQRRADALLDLATGGRPPSVALQVLVRSGGASVDGSPVADRALRRLGCSAAVSVLPVTNAGVVAAPLAEARRTPGAAMRRRLEIRDAGCRFPGCPTRARRCHAHHLRHWADGGPTTDANLVLLCSRHHHAVHEGGWLLSGTPAALAWTDGDGHRYANPPAAATIAPWPEDLPLGIVIEPDPPPRRRDGPGDDPDGNAGDDAADGEGKQIRASCDGEPVAPPF